MSVGIKSGVSQTVCGLDTYTHTAAQTGMYTVEVRNTENPTSGLVIAIKQGSTTIATAIAPDSTQNNINVRAQIAATQGDVLSVVISSSVPIDQQLNNVKTEINIRLGL